MLKNFQIINLVCISCALLLSCSKDENNPFGNDPFYNNVFKEADENKLYGIWAIHEAEFDGAVIPIPINHESCGRDFSIYKDDNSVTDYIIQDSDCNVQQFRASWSLEAGILTQTTSSGQSQELVIIELTDNSLSFRAKIDVTEDGEPDIVVINARRHTPVESNFYNYSFFAVDALEENPIELSWGSYNGIYEFDRYEIYRSVTDCTKANMALIHTIDDSETTTFIDENPPADEDICYFLKIYSVNGLIEETFVQTVTTEFIRPVNVYQNPITVTDHSIELSWETYVGHYFSHYEITVSNYFESSGYGLEEQIVATIPDMATTSWTDENPPYFKNPAYTIRAVNIFGNKSRVFNNVTTSSREADFKRPEIMELDYVYSSIPHPNESSVYLLAKDGDYSERKIYKFAYDNNSIVAIANTSLNTTATEGIKLFNDNGTIEIAAQSGSREIEIYDGNSLQSKFTETLTEVFPMSDFAQLDFEFYAFCDSKNVYVYSRNNTSFTLVDQAPHFSDPIIGAEIKLLTTGNNTFIAGYIESNNSITFQIDSNGFIIDSSMVNLPLQIDYQHNTVFNSSSNLIVNFENKNVYSANSLSIVDQFSEPYFPHNLSSNGQEVFGSNNNPEWSIDENSPHEKRAIIHNLENNSNTEIQTLGYPLFVFENHLGEILSISAGTKRESLFRSSPKKNLFIEKLER